jgi:hypothetical protein
MIQIETGIPIPPRTPPIRKQVRPRCPWTKLEIGDSFVLSGVSRHVAARLCADATKKRCEDGGRRQFTMRVIGPEQYRIWRVA